MWCASVLVASWICAAPGDVAIESLAKSEPSTAAENRPARIKKVSAVPARPTSLAELSQRVQTALRAEATAPSPARRAAAIRDLCDLLLEITRDDRLPTSETLTDLSRLLQVRLTNVKTSLAANLSSAKGFKGGALPDHPASSGSQFSSGAPPESGLQAAAQDVAAARGGGAIEDHGQELVELIEAVISPASWDVNGGKSTIVYYATWRALVVTAPAEVQGQVGGLLDGLRAAGQ